MSLESPPSHSITVSARVISAVGEGKSPLLYLLRRRHSSGPGYIRNRTGDNNPHYFLGPDYQEIDRGTNALVQRPMHALILFRPSVIILLVSADTGPTEETLLYLRLVRLLGIEAILTVITKSDHVPDHQHDQTVFRIRMALSEEGYPADDMPILFAGLRPDQFPNVANEEQNRLVDEVMEELDRISPPYVEELKPLLICVEDVFSLHPEGLAIRGSVKQGRAIPEQPIEIIGGRHQDHPKKTHLSKRMKEIEGGYDGLLLLTVPLDLPDVERGMLLVEPGSVLFAKRFRCIGIFGDLVNQFLGPNQNPTGISATIWNRTYEAVIISVEQVGESDIGYFHIGMIELNEKGPLQVGWSVYLSSLGMARIIKILPN